MYASFQHQRPDEELNHGAYQNKREFVFSTIHEDADLAKARFENDSIFLSIESSEACSEVNFTMQFGSGVVRAVPQQKDAAD